LLSVEKLSVYYGKALALSNVDIKVDNREAVAILGPNGAGKSTLLRAISNVVDRIEGSIKFLGKEITRLRSHEIVKMGIAHCPERNKIAPQLTVEENLIMGAYIISEKKIVDKNLDSIYSMFPILYQRKKQFAGTLSGGEVQMLAIGRALMSNPKLLLLDEPSQGLQPSIKDLLLEKLKSLIKERELSILLTEQDVYFALELCERGYVLESGHLSFEGNRKDLLDIEAIRKSYFGI
jgi:branched-chain amino acid transport system ATP-binding protein